MCLHCSSPTACRVSAWCQHTCRVSAWYQHTCMVSAWYQHTCMVSAWCQHTCRVSAWYQHTCRVSAWYQHTCRVSAWYQHTCMVSAWCQHTCRVSACYQHTLGHLRPGGARFSIPAHGQPGYEVILCRVCRECSVGTVLPACRQQEHTLRALPPGGCQRLLGDSSGVSEPASHLSCIFLSSIP
uniref:Uncharacterized protein n=1 Tax=Serinus canaria TaxID=9135 RepID=A0A8C9NRE9_SERCA